MYNLLIALAAGVVAGLLVKLFGFSLWAGIVPGIIVLLGVYVVLARRSMQQVQAIMGRVQKELSIQPTSQRELEGHLARAVKLIESAMPIGQWQFMVRPELHSQIGSLYYVGKDLAKAAPHFAQGSKRNAMAKAMEGALHYRQNNRAAMTAAFELAVK